LINTDSFEGALAGAAHHHASSPRPWWERLILWLGHAAEKPSQLHPGHLLPVLVHYAEVAGIATAILVAIAALWRLRRFASDASAWSPSGVGMRRFRLLLPEVFERDGLIGFFRTASLLLRPLPLGIQPSVAFTFSARGQRLDIELDCTADIAPPVVAGLEAAIDGVSVDEIPAPVASSEPHRWAHCTLRPSGSRWLPLESKHKIDPARQVLAMLDGDGESEAASVQVMFSPLRRRARRRARGEAQRLRTGHRGGVLAGLGRFGAELANEGLDVFTPGSPPSAQTRSAAPTYAPDRWALQQARAVEEKTAEPLLAVTVRLAVSGGTRGWMRWRLRALAASFAQFHALGGLRPGREGLRGRRFERRLPALRPPLTLTAAEAAALLPLPTSLSETRLMLAAAPARRLPPTADAPRTGLRLGRAER
jgi:hypothetical protein